MPGFRNHLADVSRTSGLLVFVTKTASSLRDQSQPRRAYPVDSFRHRVANLGQPISAIEHQRRGQLLAGGKDGEAAALRIARLANDVVEIVIGHGRRVGIWATGGKPHSMPLRGGRPLPRPLGAHPCAPCAYRRGQQEDMSYATQRGQGLTFYRSMP